MHRLSSPVSPPKLRKEVGSGQGGHGEFQFIEIGGVWELVCERGRRIEKLAVTDRTIQCIEISGGEELD